MCRLLLQLLLLSAQITSEELEDDLPSKEERADTRLKEHGVAERNDEESVPEEREGDGQRNGEEAERPDQTVRQLQVPCSDSCCPMRSREVLHVPASAVSVIDKRASCAWALSEAENTAVGAGMHTQGVKPNRKQEPVNVWLEVNLSAFTVFASW